MVFGLPKSTPVNFSNILFLLLLVFLPQQFGPHFWPAFSLVHGIRLDYLSPSIYVSDILILLLFILSFKKVFSNILSRKFLSTPLLLLFVLVLALPLFYAASFQALLFGLLKSFEFFYVGLYLATQITKKDLPTIIEIFAFLGVLESILGIAQFINQGSLGSVLYFVGERYYTASSIGAAVMNTGQGLLVRPYGTFSHPNILAFFLFIAVVLSTYGMHHAKRLRRYLLLASVLILEAGLFLTFSRTVLVANILFLLYAFGYVSIKESKGKLRRGLFVFFLILFTAGYILFFNNRFLDVSSFIKDFLPRQDLMNISFSAIQKFPLFGAGLNNLYYYEAALQKNFSSVYLQPVHNVFLLIFAQTGLVGGVIFVYFMTVVFLKNVSRVRFEKKIFSYLEVPLVLFSSLLFVGLFDHFFLTIEQGQLLFAVILGLSFSRLTK
ncbi:MAG: O-antigen ligase family protein [Candidatus Levyibacteriota bacterium]